MSTVVLMLSSETALPMPQEPGFLIDRDPSDMDSSPSRRERSSSNGLTISLPEPR